MRKKRKVIFLDIDGVLNDEGDEREKGVVIEPYFVQNLFQIVDKTGAEIILSSSWRYSYGAYAQKGFPGDNKDLEDLLQAQILKSEGKHGTVTEAE